MYLKSCIFTLSVLLIHKQRTVLCEVNRYSQLSAPFNGSLQPCSNLPDHTCQFSYEKGHDLDGSARRTCTVNGTWTGAETQCNANDEMSSPSEDRSPHYKLAWGILAGIIPLTLVKLIYIKKYHRVKSQAKEYTFTPEINTCEVLSKHGTMNREVPFKVSICEGVPPIGKDATGLISWDDTKIISNDSAALHPKYTTQADGFSTVLVEC